MGRLRAFVLGVLACVAILATSSMARAQISYETGTISGAVLTTGAVPVDGLRIRVQSVAGEGWGEATTDALGEYSLVVPVGQYQVSAHFDWEWQLGESTVDVLAGATAVADFTFVGGTVSWTITEDGGPSQWARVQIRPKAPTCAEADFCHWYQSGPDGDHCDCEKDGIQFWCDPWSGCEWMMHAEFHMYADELGVASRLLPAGEYELTAFSSWNDDSQMGMGGHASIVVGFASATIVDQSSEILPALDYATGSVSGIVTRDGQPVVWAQVRLRALDVEGYGWGQTNELGEYNFVVPPGRYQLGIENQDPGQEPEASQEITVVGGTSHVLDFPLTTDGEGAISGTVQQDGSAAQYANVEIFPLPPTCAEADFCHWYDSGPDGDHCDCEKDGIQFWCDPWSGCEWMQHVVYWGNTDETGEFTVSVPPGNYDVWVTSSLWTDSQQMAQHAWFTVYDDQVAVVDGETTDVGLIAYQTGTISGTLTNCGEPTSGLSIRTESPAGNAQLWPSSDDSYSLRVIAGEHTVAAYSQEQRISESVVTVPAAGDVDFSVDSQSGQLRGYILRDGEPSAYSRVALRIPVPTCAEADFCHWYDSGPDGDHCDCEKDGVQFWCEPSMGCEWMGHHDDIYANTGSDGYFTVDAPPGAYEVRAYSSSQNDPQQPEPGGHVEFLVGTVPAVVMSCQLTEIGASAVSVDPGTDVVADLGSGVTLTFDSVQDGGGVSYVATSTPQGDPEPAETIEFVGMYYDIIVEATYDQDIELCLPYDAEAIEVGPEGLRIFHYEDGSGWVDITTTVDPVNQIVCGLTSSFSWFVLGQVLNSPPVADAGSDFQVEVDESCTAMLPLDGSASSDPDGHTLTYQWLIDGTVVGEGANVQVPSGLGVFEAELRVSDSFGASHSDQVTVHVVDSLAPALEVELSQDVLWPPNGKMIEVVPTITVSDNCDDDIDVSLSSLSCDAADVDDMSIDVSSSFWLRAFRSGRERDGRVYVAEFEAVDQAGNAAVVETEVLVPHDNRR